MPNPAHYVVLDESVDVENRAQIVVRLPDPLTRQKVVIDCTRVSYIDASTLGMLVKFRRRFISGGGNQTDLRLMVPKSGFVRRAFEITGLTRLFPTTIDKPSPAHSG